MADEETIDVVRRLSVAEDDRSTGRGISRRRFLQLAALGVGGPMLVPTLLDRAAWAATPVGPADGILVTVFLYGGNDGLNTVVPTADARYRDVRGSLAVDPATTLPLTPSFGLHPSLAGLKRRWDAGQVAVVQGIGITDRDLSHFSSMAEWWSGGPLGATPAGTGWVGRYLDGLTGTSAPDPLHAVALGSSVPLIGVGQKARITAMPTNLDRAMGGGTPEPWDARLWDGLRAYGAAPTGLGAGGDAWSATGGTALDLAGRVTPAYGDDIPSRGLPRQLAICARLINLDLGLRVLYGGVGDYDTHASQSWRHRDELAELDAGIEAFFAALDPAFAGRTTVLVISEFGRRPQVNGSGGTDHGNANVSFLVGPAVRGGLHGEQPSLSSLDRSGNMVPTVDHRSLLASVLSRWMGADATEVLGAQVPELDLFAAAPSSDGVPTSPPPAGSPVAAPVPVPSPGYWVVPVAGAPAAFGARPSLPAPAGAAPAVGAAATASRRGMWVARSDGSVDALGDAPALGSLAGTRLASPVVGMASTTSGLGYWLLGGDGGIFSFGDAPFHGSTGGLRLNKPVVAMASVPGGSGYWFVASDGGIFCYGPDARFFGSTGGVSLNQPIVGMAATRSGRGYWLVARDGGIFCFGDATFHGSTGAVALQQPIVGMAATPSGGGYWLVARDGGVFCFGDASFHGSLGGTGATAAAIAA